MKIDNLCSTVGRDHKIQHVLNRQMTSLMVMLKMAMQMKSMTQRAERRWGTSLAKNYRKKKRRNQQNAVRRSERRRPAAGTSGFLHRNVNYILQIEGFRLICSKCWNPWVVFSPICNNAFQPDGGAAEPRNIWKETAYVLAYKKFFLNQSQVSFLIHTLPSCVFACSTHAYLGGNVLDQH